jgi:hypothetical protein
MRVSDAIGREEGKEKHRGDGSHHVHDNRRRGSAWLASAPHWVMPVPAYMVYPPISSRSL